MRASKAAAAGATALLLALAATPAGAQSDEGATTGDSELRVTTLVLRVESIEGDVRTSETEEQVVVDLAADVLFAFDSDELAPAARATLADLAATLTEEGEEPVTVVGHTDAVGSDTYNQDLSERRAASVVAALEPLTPGFTFAAEGRGESEPVADEATPEGAARNRRVTVTFAKPT